MASLLACGDDRGERIEKVLPLAGRKTRKQALVGGMSRRLSLAEHSCALSAKLDGVGSGVFPGAAPNEQSSSLEPRNKTGHGRTVNAGTLDQIGLAYPFFIGDRHQHGELTRCQSAGACVSRKNFRSALIGAVKQMRNRAFKAGFASYTRSSWRSLRDMEICEHGNLVSGG